MKIVLKVSKDENGSESHRLDVDGKCVASIAPLCECPEDATIERDLIGGDQIIDLMRKAHEAGTRGESFDVEEIADTDEY